MVIPPERSALAWLARLPNASPAAAAIAVSNTMIAITHGIGPDKRVCGTSWVSELPKTTAPTVRRRSTKPRESVGGALIAGESRLGAGDNAAPRSDRTAARDRAA